jgi:hypothetical protein
LIQLSAATTSCLFAICPQLSNCHFKRLNYPLSVITSAGLGFSLYGLGVDPNAVSNNSSVVACIIFAALTCLPSRCIAVEVSSGSTIQAFRRHVTYICVCVQSSKLLLALAGTVILGSESRGTHGPILLCNDSESHVTRVCVL